MSYKHHQGQATAARSALPPHNYCVDARPDFSKPPPAFMPNCQVPPPSLPHLLTDHPPPFSLWKANSDPQYNAPSCSQPREPHTYTPAYFQAPVNAMEMSPLQQDSVMSEPVDDKDWVEFFMKRIAGNTDKNVGSGKCDEPPKKLQIFEAKLIFDECRILVDDLEKMKNAMTDGINSISVKDWEDRCAEVSKKKLQLEEILCELSEPAVIINLSKALVKRRKKRAAMKRQRIRQKDEKLESLKRQHQLHLSIDTWLEEMQQAAEKVKVEESLKQQADSVLSDVTRKKIEARRQLSLLSMLAKLRRIRVQSAAERGEKTSMELVHIFENVVEKLQKYWLDQLKDYNLEEKGLRVMLEEASEDNSMNKSTLHQRNMLAWQKLLFGRKTNVNGFFTAAESNIEDFIKIRQQWDKYVVPPGVPMASPMPIGWVVPVQPSSEKWETLLVPQTRL